MAKECAGGLAPVQNTNSYILTKAEFTSIFGGGNDTVVQDFYFFGGLTTITIPLVGGFCNNQLGDYEDISNLEILLSLLTFPQPTLTLIAGTLIYLKIQRNVMRFLQEARVCDCKKATATEPEPFPQPTPNPNPNDPPPDTCCTQCFQDAASAIEAGNVARAANYAAIDALYPFIERQETYTSNPNPPSDWVTLDCSPAGFPCQIAEYRERGGTWVVSATGEIFLQGQFQQQLFWDTGTKLLYRHFCDFEPQPTPTPTPTPTPLPPDSFNFCEQFPALCNACPDVGNSQDVVVSGKIASTCAVKDDISFNVKF